MNEILARSCSAATSWQDVAAIGLVGTFACFGAWLYVKYIR